jgi:hypothetical protein
MNSCRTTPERNELTEIENKTNIFFTETQTAVLTPREEIENENLNYTYLGQSEWIIEGIPCLPLKGDSNWREDETLKNFNHNVVFDSVVPGILVSLDGQEFMPTPFAALIPEGSYFAVYTNKDFKMGAETLFIGNQRQVIDINLEPTIAAQLRCLESEKLVLDRAKSQIRKQGIFHKIIRNTGTTAGFLGLGLQAVFYLSMNKMNSGDDLYDATEKAYQISIASSVVGFGAVLLEHLLVPKAKRVDHMFQEKTEEIEILKAQLEESGE